MKILLKAAHASFVKSKTTVKTVRICVHERVPVHVYVVVSSWIHLRIYRQQIYC